MDAIQPVGAEVAPLQQSNPLQTYAGILGIKQQGVQLQQQEQNLETGRYQQQQQQSEAQNQQEQMQERMQLQQAMQTGKDDQGNPLKDANGELIPGALVSYARRALPLIGNQVAQNVLQTQTDKTNLSSAVEGLQSKYRTDIGGILAGHIGNNSTPDQVQGDLDQYARQNPDAAAAVFHTDQLVNHLGNTQDPGQKDQALSHLASVYQGQSATTPGMIDKGGSLQPTAANRFGLAPIPEGAPISKTLPPQVISPPGGVPQVVGGGNGNSVPSQFPGPQPMDADITAFNTYQQNLNARVQSANKSLPQLKLADQALSAINAGAGSSTYKSIAEKLQAIGAPKSLVDAVGNGNLAESQLAAKYMFQSALGTLVSSGGSSTNDQVQRALTILPDVDKDPRASHELLQVLTDQGQTDYAEQNALVSARKGGSFNPATWENDWANKVRSGKQPGVPSSQVPGSQISGTPDGSKSTSKSGKPIIYHNGRWEYQ